MWGLGEGGGHGRGHRGKGKQEHSGAHCRMISVVYDETSTIGIFKPAHMSFSENLSGKCENAKHIVQIFDKFCTITVTSQINM